MGVVSRNFSVLFLFGAVFLAIFASFSLGSAPRYGEYEEYESEAEEALWEGPNYKQKRARAAAGGPSLADLGITLPGAENTAENAPKPSKNGEKPSKNTQKPSKNGEKPSKNTQKPSKNGEKPSKNAKKGGSKKHGDESKNAKTGKIGKKSKGGPLTPEQLRKLEMRGNVQQTMAFARLDPLVYNARNRRRAKVLGEKWSAMLMQASLPVKVFDVEPDSLLLVAPKGELLIETSDFVLEQSETMYLDWNSHKYYPANKDAKWVENREKKAKKAEKKHKSAKKTSEKEDL